MGAGEWKTGKNAHSIEEMIDKLTYRSVEKKTTSSGGGETDYIKKKKGEKVRIQSLAGGQLRKNYFLRI